MSDPTFIACPHCGEPVVMTPMQQELFRGRTLACLKCAKPFQVDPQRTPLFELSSGGRAQLLSPPPASMPHSATEGDAPAVAPSGVAPASPSRSSTPASKAAATPANERWKLPAFVGGVALLLSSLLAMIVVPPVRSARAAQRQLNCASHLRQIGIALQIYASQENGQYPDDLGTLVAMGLLPADMLVCPATGHTPPNGATPQLQANNLRTGAHVSYVYLGKGMTTHAARDPQTVVLYEPLDNHGPAKGTHLLYANGSMSFLVPPAAGQTVKALSVPGTTTAPLPTPPAADGR